MKCKFCDDMIPEARLDAIPDADSCVMCKEKFDDYQICGFMSFSHKTGGEVQLCSVDQLVEINRLDRRGYNKNTLRVK